MTATMDKFYVALILYKNRKYDKCIDKCTKILEDSPLDQAAWTLKMRAMTRTVLLDDLDLDTDFNADEEFIWRETIATAPRPGTSLRNPVQSATALRRPGTGVNHLTGNARTITANRLRTARTPGTARALLATAQARALRLGTATMILSKDEMFIQPSKLNLPKYAQELCISKPLFEYLFYHEGDYRHAMELAVQATKFLNYGDWWWKVALANCYTVFNLIREAEQQLRSASKHQLHVDIFLRLIRCYVKLDQPSAALDVVKQGLDAFPEDVKIMTEQARILEGMGDSTQSVRVYRSIAMRDAMNIEAIASIAIHHFYNDQPEMALRYYRRVLAMGAYSAEVFNNVALCCLRAQHWDLILGCYRRALLLATDIPVQANIWYNLSHLGLAIGDINLAIQCLRLCVNLDPTHATALNNLAGLEKHLGHISTARSLFVAALSVDPTLPEAVTNLKMIDEIK